MINKVISYLEETKYIDNNSIDIIKSWLSKNMVIAYAIEGYIRSHDLTKVETGLTRHYIIDDYAFSHFLLLIDTLAKSLSKFNSNGSSNRDRYTQFVEKAIDGENLEAMCDPITVDGFHCYCIDWDSIIPLKSRGCNGINNWDPRSTSLDNEFTKKCKYNRMTNMKKSFSNLLYQIRCTFVHDSVLASSSMGIIIYKNSYIHYHFGDNFQKFSLGLLEELIFKYFFNQVIKH